MTESTASATTPSAVPIYRGEGDGEQFWFAGGGIFTRKLTAAETNGAFLLWENLLEKGHTTPLHIHPHEDETFFILDGEILVHFNGAEQQVSSGGVAFIPRGLPHAFMVTSDSARILVVHTPGGGEQFYLDAGKPLTGDDDLNRPPDLPYVLAAVQRNSDSITFVGPPPFQHPSG